MFAVPGWSVSSSLLKTQRTEPPQQIFDGSQSEKNVDAEASKPTKKRKRSSGKSKAKDVNPTNLADLWETVIEGKQKVPVEARGDKRRKIAQKSEKHAPSTPQLLEKLGSKTEAKKPDENNAAANRMIKHASGLIISKVKDSKEEQEILPELLEAKPEEKGSNNGKTSKQERKSAKKMRSQQDNTTLSSSTASNPSAELTAASQTTTKLTPLQANMRQKLVSARFRHLNQTLYTTPSNHSMALFQENPEMFTEYHEGFRRQVEVWPENPIDSYLAQVKLRGKARTLHRSKGIEKDSAAKITPLPRTEGCCHIADLGCGDAALSIALQPYLRKLNLKVHSFDLQSPSPLVTKADIANLPLADGSIDVAIFCLALMGTNWIDFIEEAFRALRWKGELWIAEIKSRFGRVGRSKNQVVDHSVGSKKRPTENKKEKKKLEEESNDAIAVVEVDGLEERGQETDVSAFVEVLRKRGFVLKGEGSEAVDMSNKMFVKMHFVKGITPIKGKCVPLPKDMENMGFETWKKKPKGKFVEEQHISSEAGVLKPCVYKLR